VARVAIEVAYVPAAGAAVVLPLEVEAGTTLAQAIERSGLLQRCPEIDLARCGVGVFGEARGLDQAAGPGDRIEVYRPLPADPKELRRRRAARR
jgi:hypothetical protein